MIDHVTIVVSDYPRSRTFYLAALAPLGFAKVMELSREMIPMLPVAHTIGIGPGGKPEVWLRPWSDAVTPVHVALRANDRAAVDAFYRAALEAGGTDNGAPGPRPHYHANYYGAFVLDPDGHNIEAVCHAPA
jgi:catechol 2,3-dioxygenase-like lactoylglutathione lyase family enzyme